LVDTLSLAHAIMLILVVTAWKPVSPLATQKLPALDVGDPQHLAAAEARGQICACGHDDVQEGDPIGSIGNHRKCP
jgi:hypothetical protein